MAAKTKTAPKSELEKYLHSIKTAGQWSRALGWALAGGVPLLFLLQEGAQNYALLILYLVVAVPTGFYLLYSGKYIQNGGGKQTPKYLLLNSLIALLCLGGFIPILACISALIGYFNYRKLRKLKALGKIKKGNHALSLVEVLIFLAVVILGATALAIKANSSQKNGTSGSPLTIKEKQEYASAEHGFEVDFRGTPTIDKQTISASGYSIPYTTYDTSDDTISYMVAVYDYTVISGDFDEHAALEGAVNGMAQEDAGGKLISSNFTSFYGYDAIDATMSIPHEGKTYTAYAKVVAKNRVFYMIFTVGVDKAAFDVFANSFHFTR